jgi:hypothetical protein
MQRVSFGETEEDPLLNSLSTKPVAQTTKTPPPPADPTPQSLVVKTHSSLVHIDKLTDVLLFSYYF